MRISKKISIFVAVLLLSLSIAMIVNFAINLRNFTVEGAVDKAESIAESVRDGLTSHMVNGTMDNRDLFFNNMMKHQDVDKLKIFRSKTVIEQFGKGEYDKVKLTDSEIKVLETGEVVKSIIENPDNFSLQITIPYIATTNSTPKCLNCHINAHDGSVLGAISMEISMNDLRTSSLYFLLRVVFVSVVFLIISIYISGVITKPYIKFFQDMEDGVKKAHKGNFSFYIATKLKGEAGKLASRLNELAEISRFKKIIEFDKSPEEIYQRLAFVIIEHFHIENFFIIEIDEKYEQRKIVFSNTTGLIKEEFTLEKSKKCLSKEDSKEILSLKKSSECELCKANSSYYLCVPYKISERNSLIIHFRTQTKEEIIHTKKVLPVLLNYFDTAKPVLISKILMGYLEDKTLRDGLTNLYNRRFLENYLDNAVIEGDREFSILMLDIDHFKSVNDTYGHDVGDLVIKEVALTVLLVVEDGDLVIRYGGEEFVVILNNTNKERSLEIAQTIKEKFKGINFQGKKEVFSRTVSIGIAKFPIDNEDPVKVLKMADEALYTAKNRGRDRVVMHETKKEK